MIWSSKQMDGVDVDVNCWSTFDGLFLVSFVAISFFLRKKNISCPNHSSQVFTQQQKGAGHLSKTWGQYFYKSKTWMIFSVILGRPDSAD